MKNTLKYRISEQYGSITNYCKAMGFTRQNLYIGLDRKSDKFIKRIADSLRIKEDEYRIYF